MKRLYVIRVLYIKNVHVFPAREKRGSTYVYQACLPTRWEGVCLSTLVSQQQLDVKYRMRGTPKRSPPPP